MDQANGLREMVSKKAYNMNRGKLVRKCSAGLPLQRVIAVTSGKGGVGKTNIVGNLSIALRRLGKRVLILDGDLGLANIDIIYGINPKHTIEEVKDNRVYKISGMSPLDFYEKYLGEYVAKSLPATGIEFPLIIEKNDIQTARAVITKHNDGSLSFAGNLNKGDKVKLGFGNVEMIMDDPFKYIFKVCDKNNTQSFFIYSCMARRRYMPDIINLEIEPFANIAKTSGFLKMEYQI